MKLVEILALEMDEWPDTTVCYTQDKDGSCYPWTGTPIFYGVAGEWAASQEACIDQSPIADGFELDVASDHATAIVTREMWEAERAKLNRGVEWGGEGLPPVGSICEGKECGEWVKVEIIAHYDGRAVCMLPSKERVAIADPASLRPIRTPEQIAAENREKAIIEMKEVFLRGASGFWKGARLGIEALYDAGYRKQEKDQ